VRQTERRKPTGEEWEQLVEQYQKADKQGKRELAKQYDVTYGTLRNWVSEGATTPVPKKEKIRLEDITTQSLPQIDIIPVPQIAEGEGEETQVLLISDLQAGQKSATYNAKILKQEIEIFTGKSLKLCELHRKMRPIKKLHVCLLGDIIENMNIPIPPFEELEHVVIDQIFEVAVPALNSLLVSHLNLFDEIEVYCVRGNHGQLEGRRSISSKTNWDTFAYRILQTGLSNFDKIHFHIEMNEFYQVISIFNTKILLVHGDQIPGYLGLPFYGIDRRTLRWNVSIPGNWQYCFMGHFHVCNYIRPSGIPVFINGTWASGTQYPLHRLGLQDDPRQWILFMSPKRGVTAQYDVKVNEKL
jgi:hypothetical protein